VSGQPVTRADVDAAVAALAGELWVTPSSYSERLSQTTGARVVVKLENLHATGSFKERGALNKLRQLDDAARRHGVVANSAGNHGQALAYHGTRLGIPVTIVMPTATPTVKVERTRELGAMIELVDGGVEEAEARAHDLAASEQRVFVHPFDDPAVISGQGTVAVELLAEFPDIDTLVVPVGGGGLLSGIAVAVRGGRAEQAGIELVGVQTERYPSMVAAFTGRDLPCGGSTIAEGIAVARPGRLTGALVRELVDDVVAVSESSIEEALNLLLFEEKTVTEGAGAAPLAVLLEQRERFAGRTVGLVLSGGNVDPRILSQVVLRGLVRDGLLVTLELVLPDSPGTLAAVASVIGASGANIVEVSHHRLFDDVSIKSAVLDLAIETRGRAHVEEIVVALRERGYAVQVRGSQLPERSGL
jgi:threonine dehydratase